MAGPARAAAQFVDQGGGSGFATFSTPTGAAANLSVQSGVPAGVPANWLHIVGVSLIQTTPSFSTYRVDWQADANPSNAFRLGQIVTGSGGIVQSIQQGCAIISLSSSEGGASSGTVSIFVGNAVPQVVPDANCHWGPIGATEPWLTLEGSDFGTGPRDVVFDVDRNVTPTDRSAFVTLGLYKPTIIQKKSRSVLVFREEQKIFKSGSWGLKEDAIPGWDHTGMAWEKHVYESHPIYAPGNYLEGPDADDDDYEVIAPINGIQHQHTLLTFAHDSMTTDSHAVAYEEVPIETDLGNKMLQAIESLGSRPYPGLNYSSLDGVTRTLTPAAQKGNNAKAGFTCVGLVEWAAEHAGHNAGQGFVPSFLESFFIPDPRDLTKLYEVPLLSPELLIHAAKYESLVGTLTSIKQWIQGLFDPVDFLITDPIGRRLGYVEGIGLVREIPNALYPGNGNLEQFLILDPLPGTYTFTLRGVGADAFAAVEGGGRTNSFLGALGTSETTTFSLEIPSIEGSVGDVNGDGDLDDVDVAALQTLLGQNAGPGHPGDLDRSGTLDETDVGLLRQLIAAQTTVVRRYLAEGATGTFFETRLALLNPSDTATTATVRFMKDTGETVVHTQAMPAHARQTIDVKQIPGLESANFSTVVESPLPVVVDRTMTWNGGFGSHAETAVDAPATTWYLAEGSTSGPFALFYLLQNQNPTATTATVQYLLPFGAPIVKTYDLGPSSRLTIPVDDQGPDLASTDVSAVITAPLPIMVERAMYRSSPTQVFAAGHGSAGVTAPSTHWFLAEGATGPFFDCFILLANPGTTPASVTIDYLLLDGTTHTKTYGVGAQSRFTVWLDDEEIPAGSRVKPLVNVAVSSTVTSTVPIIVERAMWWPSPEIAADFWTEAHNSAGATTTGTRWALADGEVGVAQSTETYILIANTSTTAGEASVTLYFEDGTNVSSTFPLLPKSRRNVNVSVDFPSAAGRRFGAVIESKGNPAAQIVVERAMYASPGGVIWAAGTNALATKLR